MNKRLSFILLAIALAAYALGPVIAGTLGTEDRLGPVIYLESFHDLPYMMAYESAHDEKPRIPFDSWMYRRPLFYGLPRRLKSVEERQAYIETARRIESPRIAELVRMSREVEGKAATRP
jgi:hypothetical protein